MNYGVMDGNMCVCVSVCVWMGTIEIAAKKEVFGCCWTLMRLMIAEFFLSVRGALMKRKSQMFLGDRWVLNGTMCGFLVEEMQWENLYDS